MKKSYDDHVFLFFCLLSNHIFYFNKNKKTHTRSIVREVDATGDIAFFAHDGSRTEIHQLTGDTLVFEENFNGFSNFGRIDFVTFVTIVIPDLHHHTVIDAFASPFTFDSKQTPSASPFPIVKAFAISTEPSRHFQILN
jgi:hypothetical protein